MGENIAIDVEKGKVTGLVDIKEGKRTTWNQVFTENPLEPQYLLIKNIAGSDNVLVIGKVYGVYAMIKAVENPLLIYFWVPENAVQKLINPNL
ncbi:MAG: hypothetical protein HGA95_03285 [Caldiserica bacterium]|nr:hypothetical protein [Caldisericota bacterium]